MLLLSGTSQVIHSQHFESVQIVKQKATPTDGYLYLYPSTIVKQAARNLFAHYDVTSTFVKTREYFTFSADVLGLVLMNGTYVQYWIEDKGDEKSILHLTLFDSKTDRYTPVLRYSIVQNKIKELLNAIGMESMSIANHLLLSEQYNRVVDLTNELQTLHQELLELQANTSINNDATAVHRVRSSIRIKTAQLNQETDILDRLKLTVDL